MKLDQTKLTTAVEAGIITREQADNLWLFWQGDKEKVFQGEDGSSAMSKFLYYLGALVVISAMGWLMNTSWAAFAGAGLFGIAALYAALLSAAAYYLRKTSIVLSGLLIIMAVCMTPLGVFGLQKWLSFWPYENPGAYRDFYHYIKGGWFTMEVATLLAGTAALRFSRIPFAAAPVAFVLWFMSMDATSLFFTEHSWNIHPKVSVGFGLAMLVVAFAIDRRTKVDYAKWLYIFGTVAFWGGLSLLNSDSELAKFFYCLVNVFLMVTGILIERKVFIALGGVGFFGYLSYLSWTVFRWSALFPIALTLLGLFLVYLGWVYHKRRESIVRYLWKHIPGKIINMLPQNRANISKDG